MELDFRVVAFVAIILLQLLGGLAKRLARGRAPGSRPPAPRQRPAANPAAAVRRSAEARPAAVAFPPPPPGRPPARSAGRAWEAARIRAERAAQELARLTSDLADDEPLAPLRTVVAEAEAEARGLLSRSAAAQTTDSVDDVRDGADALLRQAELLGSLVRQRADPGARDLLALADRLASSVQQPVVAQLQGQGVRVASRTPLSALGWDDRSVLQEFAASPVAPVSVPPSVLREPWRWHAVVSGTWRDLIVSTPGWSEEVAERLAEPDRERADDAGHVFASQLAAGWADVLLADAAAAAHLGAGFPRSLVRTAGDLPAEERWLIRLGETEGPAPEPPPHVRILTACRVLSRLGLRDAAAAVESFWRGCLPPLPALPLRSGWRVDFVPAALVESELDRVARVLLETPWRSLGGLRLPGLAGLDRPRTVQLAGERLLGELLAGEPPASVEPRTALAALAQGAETNVDPVLARRLLDGATFPAAPGARRPAGAPVRTRRPGRRAVWRDAVVLGEILTPPDVRARWPA